MEVVRVQEATRLMAQCYDFLSTGPTALPMADFNATAIKLAEVLVVLQGLNETRHSVPPKLHLILELALEG
eukprot:1563143-Amphidinium_carterae.1